jgi:hypothetical protein
VVAGFVLSAPDYSGVPDAASGPVVFRFYQWDRGTGATGAGPALEPIVPGGASRDLTIRVGYQHWITIGANTYAYIEQAVTGGPNGADTVATIVTALAAAINGAPDPVAVAAADTTNGLVTLTARVNNGETVACSASDGNAQVELEIGYASWTYPCSIGTQTNHGLATGQWVTITGVGGCTAANGTWPVTVTDATHFTIPVAGNATYTSGGRAVVGPFDLVLLTGTELAPVLTPGVLFAQGTMFRPAAVMLGAAPASAQSWLFYSSANGWYWKNSSTPNASDDAVIGWVVTNATQVIAVSSRKIGTGAEATLIPGGPVAIQVGSASGDTGLPPAPYFGAEFDGRAPSVLEIVGLSFTDTTNTDGVDSATFILYYVDELAGACATLTAAMGSGDTSLSASAALPAATPGQVSFTFYSSGSHPGAIGPSYVHNIAIGAAIYQWTQLTADTGPTIAAALANAINAADDPNATATAVGSVVTLAPVQNTGATVVCSASDGNTAQNLTETMPSWVLIDGEMIQVNATNGSSVTRGAKATTAAAHASGALIWAIQTQTVLFPVIGATVNTPAWPTVAGTVPFRGQGLAAIDGWVTNEYGDSPVMTLAFTGTDQGRGRGLSGWVLDLEVPGTLAIASNVCPQALMPQACAPSNIYAVVNGAPVGSGATAVVRVNGNVWATVNLRAWTGSASGTQSGIPEGALPWSVLDGMVMPAGAVVTLDITAVGTTTPGSGLVVRMEF